MSRDICKYVGMAMLVPYDQSLDFPERARDHCIYTIRPPNKNASLCRYAHIALAAALRILAPVSPSSGPQNSVESLVLDRPSTHRRPNVAFESLSVGS